MVFRDTEKVELELLIVQTFLSDSKMGEIKNLFIIFKFVF